MLVVNEVQSTLSRLHIIPVVGLVASTAKIMLGTAQIVAGLATGVMFGMAATSAELLGAHTLANGFGAVAISGFGESVSGFGSLFYGCANCATWGILGICVEITRRDVRPIYL